MAESNPLLHQPVEEANAVSPITNIIQDGLSLEKAMDQCLGDHFGWTQIFQLLIISFAWAIDAQQVFISIFTDAAPTWHCTQISDVPCNSTTNVCAISQGSWAWDLPAHVSTVSEWTLQCSSSVITSLPAASFFIGCFIGGIVLSPLADSNLGRKRMLVISCLVMSLGAFMAAFSTNVWMYAALRFVSGFGRAPITTCALVLPTEMLGRRWRGHVSLITYSFFTVGFLSLPAIAYACRGCSWRIIYLLTSVPAILYALLAHLTVFESPRWLFLRGRLEEAILILGKLLKSQPPSTKTLTSIWSQGCTQWVIPDNENMFSAIKNLGSRASAVRRLLAVMVVGFGIAMVYFGMPLGVGKLGFNLYLSVTLNALLELPASVMAFILLRNHIRRKSAILTLTLLSGIFSATCVVHSDREELKMGMELSSFFCACTAFDILLIYVVELFPAYVRNTAMAMVRQAILLGAATSPILVAADQEKSLVQYGVLGAGIGFCGLLVIFLPETQGKAMYDTMEEQECEQRTNK
ncbi:hypothetical protein Nepgr_001089 [Nepenthes gracilis]|uniref:Major facilitator superfamily (MFS) profile domain-containing protein n=1 Tax=Nepenthes gracilis TaxID=150966 RepID=A0AAD3P2B8_NEPGR|nr:hypothetical protein Nepgr_001089 [Nepenthes gracilis]